MFCCVCDADDPRAIIVKEYEGSANDDDVMFVAKHDDSEERISNEINKKVAEIFCTEEVFKMKERTEGITNQGDAKFKLAGHPPFHFIKMSKNTGRVKCKDFLHMLELVSDDKLTRATYSTFLRDKEEINLHEFLNFIHEIKIKSLDSIFNSCDTNHDGDLDRNELKTFLKQLGYNEQEIRNTIENIDRYDFNNDKLIDYEEFKAYYLGCKTDAWVTSAQLEQISTEDISLDEGLHTFNNLNENIEDKLIGDPEKDSFVQELKIACAGSYETIHEIFLQHKEEFTEKQANYANIQNLCRCIAASKLPVVEEIKTPEDPNKTLMIVGDLHGKYDILLQIFDRCGHVRDGNSYYLFLGDYVDRGNDGLDILCILFSLKIAYPNSVWMLKGNHEDYEVNTRYGFSKECQIKSIDGNQLMQVLGATFQYLPICAVIDGKFFCSHGGFPCNMKKDMTLQDWSNGVKLGPKTEREHRSLQKAVLDVVWNDPVESYGFSQSKRGKKIRNYGPDVLCEFLSKINCMRHIRGHQCIYEGYNIHIASITIFSCPRYFETDENRGAVLKLSRDCDVGGLIFFD